MTTRQDAAIMRRLATLEYIVDEGRDRDHGQSSSLDAGGQSSNHPVVDLDGCELAPQDLVMVEDSSDEMEEEEFHPSHFMEVFSPPRVAWWIRGMNLTSCGSLDLTNGYDFTHWVDRARCRSIQDQNCPLFLMSSPPCTMFSELMRLWNLAKMNPEIRAAKQAEAKELLSFGMASCERQYQAGRFFAHEHPHRAGSWEEPCATGQHLT